VRSDRTVRGEGVNIPGAPLTAAPAGCDAPRVGTIGFLHTADAHVRAFRTLLAERDPRLLQAHLVDTGLLAAARRDGVVAVSGAVEDRLRRLLRDGADVVVCTCSTIGAQAEVVGRAAGIPVLRVDRPMAEAAVRAGRRIAVVNSLEEAAATVHPLLRECAAAFGRDVELVDVECHDTWSSFEDGDLLTYATGVADAVRRAVLGSAERIDVVVLAQASMEGAAPLLRDLSVPVLTTPRLAVESAVELVVGAAL
jgi:Asp/Glu/hydantoin racemase